MGALFSFMAMAIGGRELSFELGTFEILFFRSLIGLLIISIFLFRSGWQQVLTQNLSLHVLRNVAHFVGQFGWFYGIALISLAEVFAIEFTIPVWTAVLATFLLGERLTKARVIAICLGFLGMLIILRPGLGVVNPVSLIVLVGALGYAISHTLTRKLALRDTPLTILFYMTLIQLPLALVLSLEAWVTPSPSTWPWLVVVGVTALSAHYCLTRALVLADVTVVVTMDFLRLPLIALVGFTFYNEPLDWLVLSGALVMLVGTYVNIQGEKRKP
ncbi:MAG: DMT family transporter [Arenicellales bacterium]|nr:DMT family transporter [Arenicellales bacterium]